MTDEIGSKIKDAALCPHLKSLCYSSVIEIPVITADDVVFALQNSLKQNAHENVMFCA